MATLRALCIVLCSAVRLTLIRADPSAGGNTVTAHGVACVSWDENEFGIPEDSNRCAQVDDIPKPWCFVSDEDWDYCSPPKAADGIVAGCAVTERGSRCDKWGENDFGLPEDSDECAMADGLDRPWCYTSGDVWDFCECGNEAVPRCNHAQNSKKCAPWGENIWGLDERSDECFTADGEDDPWCFLVEADGLRSSPDAAAFSAWSFCDCTGKGPVRKPKNTFMSGFKEVYADVGGVKTPMIELAMEGKVNPWWWEKFHPYTDVLTVDNFDLLTHRKDFYVVEFFLPECKACEAVSVPMNEIAETMMKRHHSIAFGRVNGDAAVQTTGPPSQQQYDKGIEPGMVFGDALGTFGGAPIANEWYKVKAFPFVVLFQFGKRNPDVVEAEILQPAETVQWLEQQMLKNRIHHGFCQPGDAFGPGKACNSDINYILTDPNNPYAREYDAATSKGYEDPRTADTHELRKRKEGTLFSAPKYQKHKEEL